MTDQTTTSNPPPADPAQRYQVLKKLDAGGMAEIFLAKSLSIQGMEKQVAIKRVLPSLTKNAKFIEMFLDEARLSIALNHANIVQVFDVSQSGGTYFIVMEYVDGFNVRHLFQRASELGYRIPVPIACYILIEVCKGLEHAHTKRDLEGKHLRIVHRDLSPPNVLLSRSGEVKITDFGLAKASSQLSRTDPGVVKGKYSYLSPEVTEGKAADLRADLFAAGIVLWELLANRRLFFGKTDVETVDMVRKADVPSLTKLNPAVSPQLEAIVLKALARDPRKRYTSAREFGEDLANHLARGGMKATSFDLAQTLDQLFGPDGMTSAEAPAQRVSRISALIDDEIANLSMLGFSKQVRGVDGSEPLDPAKLDLASIHRPRFDLAPVWAGGANPTPMLSDAKERAPTLRAMEDVTDIAGLVRMLEGGATGALDWPDPGVTGGPRPATVSAMRVEPAKRSSGLVVGLVILVLVGVGVGLALAL